MGAEAEEIGALVASGVGGLQTFQEQISILVQKGPDRLSPLFIPMIIANMGAAQVSLELGTKGPCNATCTACAAGSNAIGDAFEIVRRGDALVMFAGGAEAPINETGVGAFAAMRALSTRNDEPEKASRPFDVGRDGFVMGEGAGMLVLEELEHAQARGARIYAEMVGYGMSADAFHLTLPDETGESQARAMKKALAQAGLEPADLDYINAHGTSTPAGDIAETRAIKLALGEHAARVAVSSTKSMTGHTPGRLRRHRGALLGARHRPRRHPADHQPHRPGPGVRPGLRAQRRPAHDGRRGRQQQLRLRRPRRHAGLPPLRGVVMLVRRPRPSTPARPPGLWAAP